MLWQSCSGGVNKERPAAAVMKEEDPVMKKKIVAVLSAALMSMSLGMAAYAG